MTEIPAKNSTVLWQRQDEGVPEPALLIEAYNDTIAISQDGDSILLNYESLEELIKALRSYAKQAKEGKLK